MIDFIRHKLSVVILLILALAISASQVLAFWLRFDFSPPPAQRQMVQAGLMLALPLKLSVFLLMRLHRGWRSYIGAKEVLDTLYANIAASALFTAAVLFLIGPSYPRSIYLLDFLVCFLTLSALRLAVRLYREGFRTGRGLAKRTIIIYGAGWAGASLVRELQMSVTTRYRILGFVDDDPRMRSERVSGVPVIGAGRDLLRIVQRYSRLRVQIDEVLIAMPSATGREMNQALANCRSAGVPCRTLPSVSSLLEGKALHRQVREVSVEDLLGRDRVRLDEATIRRSLANRVVLITGAAGSIGSELCRQIAAFGPKKLVLFDKAESDVHRIDLELRAAFPSVLVAPVIGDIRIPRRIENTLSRHRVEVIFHAAAYKHVPLMELNVAEAVENNVLGTWNVARAAIGGGVKSFVMISSDKAVNPANVMGATKRAAELLVSSLPSGDESTTKFVSVRFGNVLGSSGSVVPIFQRQIAGGGPVTVTHPEIRRYFMLIPEAAQLVLQASTMGHGSEVYVLEMGELVKIADLARNMIRLAGLKPDEDIEIRYTGLRPGEKLYEELITEGENILPTQHEKIKVFQGPAPDPLLIRRWLEKVKRLVGEDDEAGLVLALKELVPEYQISDVWNERLPVSRAKSAAATV